MGLGLSRITRLGFAALLTVQPVEGAWKLTGLELLSEERL